MSKRLLPGSAHDALDKMFDSIGRSHGKAASEGIYIAASLLDVSHWTLRAQLNPDKTGSEISYAKVVQFTRAFGCTDAAEHLALCAGGVFLPMPAGEGAFAEMSADMMREVGEALVQLAASTAPHSDGGTAMTAREAQQALPLMADVVAVASRLYAEVRARAAGEK